MSDKIDLAGRVPTLTDEANHSPGFPPPPLHRLGGRDLAQLLLGFHFLFWGLLVLLTSLTESLITSMLRPFWVIFIGASSLGIAAGAWRLHRVNTLGEEWHRRSRLLLIGAVLVAYLSLYYILWRQVPKNLYFLAHAIGFGGMLIALLCLLCLPVAALANAANRPNLAVQCLAFGTVAVVLLLPAFLVLAIDMLSTAGQNGDPFAWLQTQVENSTMLLTILGLLPFSLTLSLLWSAKDLVWQRLQEREDELNPPTS